MTLIDEAPLAPPRTISPKALEGRARLAARWARFAYRSARRGHWDFVANTARSLMSLARLSFIDGLGRSQDYRVECNICTWGGRTFYPNCGPGYFDRNTTCPGCRGIDRHRSLLALLTARTGFFAEGNTVVEVAPMRGFEQVCRAQGSLDYLSFDIERHAMVRGDITAMQFGSSTVDFFVCFHVLEHIPDVTKALSEIHRVLAVGGVAILQVPMDPLLDHTIEYDQPDLRDAGHVRQYGADFPAIIAGAGFEVTSLTATDSFSSNVVRRFGLSPDPIYLARKR